MRELAERLIDIPGVVAVTLGGPHAGGPVQADSDCHFGLYYRDAIRADDVRALGFEGRVVEPGEWGRLMNGGARLTVDDQRVDLLYRDLDVVRHWLEEAKAGRYEVDRVEGYVAGMATYALAGELALAEVLAGELPRPALGGRLRLAVGVVVARRGGARGRDPQVPTRAPRPSCSATPPDSASQLAIAPRGGRRRSDAAGPLPRSGFVNA
jgi:hypothetical protein